MKYPIRHQREKQGKAPRERTWRRGDEAARVQPGSAQELKLNLRTVCVGVCDGFGVDFGFFVVYMFVWFVMGRRGRNLVYELSLIVFPYT